MALMSRWAERVGEWTLAYLQKRAIKQIGTKVVWELYVSDIVMSILGMTICEQLEAIYRV